MSAAARRARAVARLWPAAFFVHECQRLPLKIAIDRDLIALCKPAIERGRVTVADIKSALRFYVTATGYLGACHEGAARVHLAGNVGRRRHRARRPRPQQRRRVEAAAANRSAPQPAGTPPQQPEQEKAAVRPAAKVIDNASGHYPARPA